MTMQMLEKCEAKKREIVERAFVNIPSDKQTAILAIADEYLLFVEALVNTHGQELALVGVTLGNLEYFGGDADE